MKTKLLLCILNLFLFSQAFSQAVQLPRFCDTDNMWNEAVKKDPAAAERYQMIKNRTALMQASRTTSPDDTVLFTIPVVFHVIHTYGGENISKAQIEDAVNILNLSFQKLNPDTGDVIPLFQPIFANSQIRFRLANIDPQGNCTDGITRTYSMLTRSAGDNVKSLVDWPSDKYLNIWVVSVIASGAAGYAYYPGITPNIDGVVILQDYVGSIGTSTGSNYNSRSLTHEVGHWLSLPHTWGSTNTPGLASNCSIDDGISDTPNTVGVGNFSCNTNQRSCDPNVVDNVQNYMDYASCHKMFTNGQKDQMQYALYVNVGSRDNLWTTSNLLATGTEDGHVQQQCNPIADFSSKVYTICAGESVSFKDVSWNANVTSRSWQFSGGSPSTDTSANPVVVYNTPGVYSVTLSVASSQGIDTLTRTNLVYVTNDTSQTMTPYNEGFEVTDFTTGDWVVSNLGNNNKWEVTSSAAYTGLYSARLINHSGNSNGDDILITPAYNLTNLSAAQLTFRVAYASKNTTDNSNLTVSISNNCGATWSQRYSKAGSALQTTTGTVFPSFTPSSQTQWRTETVSLTSTLFSGRPSIRFKFEFVNDNGNNIFIDDINIDGVVGTNEILADLFKFTAFPNPSSSSMHVSLMREEAQAVQLELFDVLGRKIESYPKSSFASGAFEFDIPNHNYSGMYILKLTVGDKSFQQRVMFEN